ncbi:G2/mitotic-specific cyclin-B-like [Acanthaster planci]|uniref:G2/mitotic-specific cyclin-B-like n=1 Tax=Acanthaster planci TaxID=133434 RepID=A0A8B7ZCB5_ACAPL|nr:G2/mitotic-specific cyclin-B-like [Acanthaster planci]
MSLRVRGSTNILGNAKLGMPNGENADVRINGKMVTRAASKSIKSTLGTRGALETISNVAGNNIQDVAKKDVKPKKGMTKSKATSSLQSVAGLGVEPVKKVLSPEPMDMSDVSHALEAFSQNLLDIGIDDIDKDDHSNPQLCSEYVNEIYEYMRHLERVFKVRTDYMASQEITERMRTILVDWMVQVHLRFHLLQETLFLTIQILDRYLEVQSVSKNKLQLVGVTSMLIAAKFEEMYPPEIGDFVYITDNAYSKAQILAMECDILRKLDFNLGKPLCIHFLRRNSKAGGVDGQKHTLAKYIMELTLPEYSFVQYDPSEIAAAALCLSTKILEPGAEWTKTLVHYSCYCEDHLTPIVKKMATLLCNAPKNKYQAVRKKYASSKFMSISNVEQLTSSVVTDLANQD